MSVEFCGIELSHPVVNGSGTFDAIAARRAFGPELDRRFPFSAFVSKTITVEPREGNGPPRLWELSNGLINSIGLPNKGLAGFVESDLPQLATLPVPLIVSVMGTGIEPLSQLITELDHHSAVAGFELNFSCPNVKTGLVIGADPAECEQTVAALRGLTKKPLIAKLTPNTAVVVDVAKAAESGGADSVSLINTLRGMALAPGSSSPWLGGGSGGVSGPAVRAVALAQAAEVAPALAIPVLAMGGIERAEHARALINVGAAVVAVGTENFRDPLAARRIAIDLGYSVPEYHNGAIRNASEVGE